MTRKQAWIHGAAGVALAAMSGPALAQASVSYGRVTNVQMVSQENARAQTGGAIVGGALGASLGSGRSAGNRAMTGLGGAFAGQQITRMATNSQAFEYTILVGGSTIRMVTDEAGFRVGDCVAVERGAFNNLRLVADAKCNPPPRPAQPAAQPAPAARPTPSEQRQADACIQA